MGCDARCWTYMRCPTCYCAIGPRGRSYPLAMWESDCCQEFRNSPANPRHLWDEHDSTRHYTDPDGWADHVANCETCK